MVAHGLAGLVTVAPEIQLAVVLDNGRVRACRRERLFSQARNHGFLCKTTAAGAEHVYNASQWLVVCEVVFADGARRYLAGAELAVKLGDGVVKHRAVSAG